MGDYRKSRVSILTRFDVIRSKSVFLVTKLRQLSSLRSKHFHRVRAKGFPYVRRSFPLFGLMYQSIPSAIIPPRETPGHLTPVQLHIVGHLTRIEARLIGQLTGRKNAGHRSRIKRIFYSMSQVITPRGFRQNLC